MINLPISAFAVGHRHTACGTSHTTSCSVSRTLLIQSLIIRVQLRGRFEAFSAVTYVALASNLTNNGLQLQCVLNDNSLTILFLKREDNELWKVIAREETVLNCFNCWRWHSNTGGIYSNTLAFVKNSAVHMQIISPNNAVCSNL